MGSFKEFVIATDKELGQNSFLPVFNNMQPKTGQETNVNVLNVPAGKIDTRISVIGFQKAYENMLRAIDQILSDEAATVQIIRDDGEQDKPKSWGELYFLATNNSPNRGFIEIEYAPQATKGVVGDMAYTAGWMTQSYSRPFRWIAEKLGWAKNPEKFYLSQFVKELRRLANQKVLHGLDEWDVTTSYLGRNILLKPKV